MVQASKFPYNAVHFSTAGFSLLKSLPTGQLICATYKNASLAMLQRECGVFFDTPAEQTVVVLNFGAPLLVPQALYQPPANPYLRLQYNLSDSDEVFQDDLGEYKALYAVPLSKTLPLRTCLASPKFQHTATRLYRYLSQYRTELPNKLLLHFSGARMGFMLMKEQKLFIVNEFPFTCQEDVLYHVLNILQQQQARRDGSVVLLSGAGAEVPKLAKLLSRYLPNVQLAGHDLDCSVTNLKSQKELLHTCLQLIEF